MNPKKPDPVKGKRKISPIKPPGKKIGFEGMVKKYDEYIHGPERFNKMYSELGYSCVDDKCEAPRDKKNSCTAKNSPKSKKNRKKVSPLKRK